jgi:hypothetical protein
VGGRWGSVLICFLLGVLVVSGLAERREPCPLVGIAKLGLVQRLGIENIPISHLAIEEQRSLPLADIVELVHVELSGRKINRFEMPAFAGSQEMQIARFFHRAFGSGHLRRVFPEYKTSAGVEPELLAQFPLLEDVLAAAGIVVWPMVEFEADDALAAAAALAEKDARVVSGEARVVICTPDKDLSQCVRGMRVVQLNRRTRVTMDEQGIIQKFGVPPLSIPDYLALVGDTADGYPGLAGWGAKSSAAVLAKFGHLEQIPKDCREWRVNATSASALAETLRRE